MGYRSERFEPGELHGLEEVWNAVDYLDGHGDPVVSEVMAGNRYRRQLQPEAIAAVGSVDYLLQVTMQPDPRPGGGRLPAQHYLNAARKVLDDVSHDLPGEKHLDGGGLHGWDSTANESPFGTGSTETEILQIYPAWLSARWEEAGRHCMVFMGIQPPAPQRILEDWMFDWSDHLMRHGHLVFEATPEDL